jgi:hypothetical protein
MKFTPFIQFTDIIQNEKYIPSALYAVKFQHNFCDYNSKLLMCNFPLYMWMEENIDGSIFLSTDRTILYFTDENSSIKFFNYIKTEYYQIKEIIPGVSSLEKFLYDDNDKFVISARVKFKLPDTTEKTYPLWCWMMENIKHRCYYINTINEQILFEDENDAIRFKMTWS